VSVYTIVALTIERYHCIKDHKFIENDKNKLKIIIVYIVLLWISAICFTLAKTLSIRISSDPSEMLINGCMSSFDETDEKIFTILKLLIAFALPYTLIIIFSIFLLKFLNEWSKTSQNLAVNKATFFIVNSTLNYTLEKSAVENIENKENNIQIEYNKNTLNVPVANQMTKGYSDSSLTSITKLKCDHQNTENLKLNRPLSCSQMTYQSCEITNAISNSQRLTRKEMMKRRSTKFVMAVVISFLCCWSPLWLFQLIMSFFDPKNSNFMRIFNNLTLIIVYCSCVFNPLLYMLLTENFREYVREIFKKIKTKF